MKTNKALIHHHNLIGHEINESLQYHKNDPLDRTIYCRKLHIVTEPEKKDCGNCPLFGGYEQGNGIECVWSDVSETELVIQHSDRYKEYERVDKLIKQHELRSPSDLIELHINNKEYSPDKWLYEQSDDKINRFVLGEKGKNLLICFGINPSTASPEDLDRTMHIVKKKSSELGYDGYIMLNVYPQRATNPNDLCKNIDIDSVNKNLKFIAEILSVGNCTIWAAWGNLIRKREYLKNCLKQIIDIADMYNCKWITVGNKTKEGHPHHPLYLPQNSVAEDFYIHDYYFNL